VVMVIVVMTHLHAVVHAVPHAMQDRAQHGTFETRHDGSRAGLGLRGR
jgi:hypothetical protein